MVESRRVSHQVFIAVARAISCGLTHTPLKPTLLDYLTVRDRPTANAVTPQLSSPGSPDTSSSR